MAKKEIKKSVPISIVVVWSKFAEVQDVPFEGGCLSLSRH